MPQPSMGYEEFVKSLRPTYDPEGFSSDEELYLWGIKAFPEKNVEPWDVAKTYKKDKEASNPTDTSPSAFQSLLSWGVDENSNWIMKNAYANSLSGVAIDWYNGHSQFSEEELAAYDPNILEEALSGVLSFAMPLDLLTLFTGGWGLAGKIGGKVSAGVVKKGIATSSINKLAKEGSKAAARRKLSRFANQEVVENTLTRMVKEGVTMAEYEGIKSNLNAQLHGENVWNETFHGVIHGGLMGSMFGLGGGYLGAQHARLLNARAVALRSGNTVMVNSLNKALSKTGKLAQFGTEVSTLQAFGTTQDFLNEDVDMTWERFGRNLLVNTGFAFIMGAKRKVIGETAGALYKRGRREYGEDLKARTKEVIEGMGENLENQKNIIMESDIPIKNKKAILKSIESQQKEIKKAINEDPDASTIETLAGRLQVFHDLAKKNPEYIVENYGDFIETVRASQAVLSQLKRIDPSLRKSEKADFDRLQEELDGLLDSAQTRVEQKEMNLERHNRQVDTVLERLDADAKRKELQSAKEDGILDKAERIRINEKYDKIKEERKDQPLHQREGELAGHEKYEELKAKPTGEIVRTVLREEGLGRYTIDAIHEIHRDQAHVDRLSRDKENFLKRADLEPYSKGIKKAILDARKEGATPLDEVAIYKAVFGSGKKGTGKPTDKTVKTYAPTVRKFFNWLNKKGLSWTKASEDDLATFYREVFGRGLSELNPSNVAPLKNLYNWANKRGNLDIRHEPHLFLSAVEEAYNRRTTKADYKLPTFEKWKGGIKNVLNKLSKGKDVAHQQGYLQFLIQTMAGVRSEELYASAEHKGFAFEDIVKIKGKWNILVPANKAKTSIARYIPINAEIYSAIKKFKNARKLKDSDSILEEAPPRSVKALVNKLLTDEFGEQVGKDSKGKKKIFRPVSDHARDMLQQIGTFGVDLSAKEINLLNYALGHTGEFAKIENIYLREMSPEQFTKDVRKVFDKIHKTEFKLDKKWYMKDTSRGIEGFFGEYQGQVQFLKEKFPSLYKHFTESKTLGRLGGQLILGRIVNRSIEIATEHASPDVLPHEIHHHVVDVLQKIGDAKSKKLIEQGIKAFGSEELLVDALGKYSRHELKGGMVSKARNFVVRFWNNMREYFGLENKGEVLKQLHGQFAKGEAGLPEGYEALKLSEAPQYKLDINKPRGKIQGQIKAMQSRRGLARKQLSGKKYANQLQKDVMEALGYDKNAVKHIKSTLELNLPEAQAYYDYILNRPMGAGKGGYFTHQERARNQATDKYAIPVRDQIDILEAIGVKDGLWENASKEHTNIFMSLVRKNYSEVPPQDNIMSLMDTINRDGVKLPLAVKRFLTPAYIVMKRAGEKLENIAPEQSKILKKISQSFIDYDILSEHYIGEAKKLDREMLGYLGRHEDLIVYIDEVHPRKNLSKEKLKFLESDDFAKAQQVWADIRTLMWEGVKHEMKTKLSPAKYAEFEKDMSDKYIINYMTRTVNPELQSAIWNGQFGTRVPVVEKMYQKNLKTKAEKEASKNYKKNGTKWKQVVEELTDKNNRKSHEFQDGVWEDLRMSFTFNPSTMKVGFLKERGVPFDEKVEIITDKGKRKTIDAYDKTKSGTVDRYIMGMTKLISSLRFFPEWTELGREYGLKHLGADWTKLEINKGDMSDYIKKTIRRTLGLDAHDANNPSEIYQNYMGQFANLGAATGLSSFIFSQAQKNVVLGTIRTVGTFGGWNTMKAVVSTLDPEIWESGFKYGEAGTKALTLENRSLPVLSHAFKGLTMEKVIKATGMLHTEKFNRIVAANAGQLWFDSALRSQKGEGNMLTGMMYRDWNRMLDEVYQLSDSQRSWVHKNSLKEIYSKENAPMLLSIRNKVAHYSHETTQGGTTVGKLPLWMSNRWIKPWTLFTRIATSVTHDTYRNYMRPIYTSKNPMPLIRAFMGAQLGGAYMWGMYDWAFSLQDPTEQSDNTWHKIMSNAWRAEFLGLFGEIINPYSSSLYSKSDWNMVFADAAMNGGAFSDPYLSRQIVETAKFVYFSVSRPGEAQTWKTALPNWANKTSVAIGQATKFMKKRGVYVSPSSGISIDKAKGSIYEESQRLETFKSFFEREKKYNPTSFEGHSRRQPYYRELRDVFWLGDEKQRAQSFWKTYAYVVTDLEREGYTSAGAHKQAINIIKGLVKRINPLAISVDIKGREISKKSEFLNYLDSDWRARATELEKKFFYHNRQFWVDVSQTKWRDKWSVYFDRFDID